MPAKLYHVCLTPKERESLQRFANTGTAKAREITRARILLLADKSARVPSKTDEEIVEILAICRQTVAETRRRFVQEGLDAALGEKSRSGRPKKFSGRDEAKLTAIACSDPPEGRARWTLHLLADKLVELSHVESISHETVRAMLKRSDLKPWQRRQWCIGQINGEFLARMEDVLYLYEEPYDPKCPTICYDERPCQLLDDVIVPIPMTSGSPKRQDHRYKRNGTCVILIAFEPLTGHRFIEIRDHRKRADYAEFMKNLIDKHYPDVEVIRLVQDNLNTHTAGSFYETFDPSVARDLSQKLEFYYTPKKGSWLNMVEIELSALSKQCLDRRIGDKETLKSEVAAWVRERNQKQVKVDWRFTTNDAREKLGRHYTAVKEL